MDKKRMVSTLNSSVWVKFCWVMMKAEIYIICLNRYVLNKYGKMFTILNLQAKSNNELIKAKNSIANYQRLLN